MLAIDSWCARSALSCVLHFNVIHVIVLVYIRNQRWNAMPRAGVTVFLKMTLYQKHQQTMFLKSSRDTSM